MMPVRGSVLLHGRVALAAQEAWLFSGTLRENILFGSAFEEDRYWATIEACALARDLEILKGGDQVIIGEKGITVSGGQKARIALARAVYARTEILLLDDPLAAVDTHVGDHIFETLTSRCVRAAPAPPRGLTLGAGRLGSELVAGRLVVLVTSQMSRLKVRRGARAGD
jgi:ABC-type transport system involved in Fe-S cluster assembly fused permease/ATPase subunit